MTFAARLINFFETLFGGSSPEQKAKRELRKIETDLRSDPPVLKSGMLQPLFAQALFILFTQTREIGEILEVTLFSEVASKKHRCIEVIMTAGFTPQMRTQLADLTYEKKKKAAFEDTRSLDIQHSVFDKLIHEISASKNLQKIQTHLQSLERLRDICVFDYVSPLKLFDHNFSANVLKPTFCEVPLEAMEHLLMDIYFLTADFVLTNSLASILYILRVLQNENSANDAVRQELLTSLRQISAALSKVLNRKTLENLLRVLKKDLKYIPPVSAYETPYVEKYCQWMRSVFNAEKNQIEMEVKNERIAEDLRVLFEGRDLLTLTGYNNETNERLHQDSRNPFLWVLPMQTIKTFFQYYLTPSIENLLDTVIVEGFFTDQLYQSSFAAALFSCKEAKENFAKFEAAFSRGGEASSAVLTGFINGARRNLEDGRLLEALILKYNDEAKKIMEETVHQIVSLIRMSGEILSDFKRSKSEIVSNLKVLFLSARNKEASELLDRQYSQWLKFIEIMGNYVIIKKAEQPAR